MEKCLSSIIRLNQIIHSLSSSSLLELQQLPVFSCIPVDLPELIVFSSSPGHGVAFPRIIVVLRLSRRHPWRCTGEKEEQEWDGEDFSTIIKLVSLKIFEHICLLTALLLSKIINKMIWIRRMIALSFKPRIPLQAYEQFSRYYISPPSSSSSLSFNFSLLSSFLAVVSTPVPTHQKPYRKRNKWKGLITSLRMRTPFLKAWQATNSQLTRFIPSLKDVTSATSDQESRKTL